MHRGMMRSWRSGCLAVATGAPWALATACLVQPAPRSATTEETKVGAAEDAPAPRAIRRPADGACGALEDGGAPMGTQRNGSLPPAAIQEVVRARFDLFRSCYLKALDRKPDLRGGVATKFVIARDG
jgi:hypothetical protein